MIIKCNSIDSALKNKLDFSVMLMFLSIKQKNVVFLFVLQMYSDSLFYNEKRDYVRLRGERNYCGKIMQNI